MKTRIKKLIFPLLLIAVLIAANAIIYYTSVCSAEIIQSRDIYGSYYSSDMRSVNNRKRLINSLSGNYEKDIEKLSAEVEKLTVYKQTADYILNDNYTAIHSLNALSPEERREYAEEIYSQCLSEFPVSEERIFERLNDEVSDYQSILDYIAYLSSYNSYITDISERSDFLSDISIYSDNDSAIANIVKTKKDFYGLSGIPLTPVAEDGFLTFINFRLTDFLAVLIALVSLSALSFGEKISLASPVLLTAFGTFTMYLCSFLLTCIFIGVPDPDVTVQSMEIFKSCPYMINVGLLTLTGVLMKVLGAVIILLGAVIIITSEGRKKAAAAAVSAASVICEIFFAVFHGTPDFLREINLLSCFSFERFFIRYLNLELFGITVSRLPVFILFLLIITSVMFFLGVRCVTLHNSRLIKENEQCYYDEINRRYQESRKIRHDINNHLLAISALIESGSIEQAKKYITEVSEQTDLTAMPVKTGSEVLDALLFKKTEQAAEKQVTLLFDVSRPLTDCGISDYDLCTVFGNIIDNALEAVSEKDTVSVAIGNQLDMLYISCENPFRGTLKRRGDKILTTKPNPLSHGYGIIRVKEIAKRYGGDVSVTDKDGKFLIEVLMNIKV